MRTCARCKRIAAPVGRKPGLSISRYSVQQPDGKMVSVYLCLKCARKRGQP